MVAMSSFLEVAKSSAKEIYQKMYGHMAEWNSDPDYVAIRDYGMKKFCQHGRQAKVWAFLESIGVSNFDPEEPADIDGWRNWLAASQLFELMEWLFDQFCGETILTEE